MKNWNKGRFARVAGAMGAAMLMVVAPAAVVDTGINVGAPLGAPIAHAQDDEDVAVPTEEASTSTATVTEEAPAPRPEPAPAPAPAPVPAPAEEAPVPPPADADDEVADRSATPETEEEADPSDGLREPGRVTGRSMARAAVAEPGIVTDPALLNEFGLTAPNPVCVDSSYLWVSSDTRAYQIRPDGTMTGKSVVKAGRTTNEQWGSAIALNREGTILYAANFQNQNNGTSIFLRRFDTTTGEELSTMRTTLPRNDVGGTVRNLNSLSMSPSGTSLYLGGAGGSRVWEIDVNPNASGRHEVLNTFGPFSGITGWGGDFITLANGGLLGATNDGRLVFWPTGFAGGAPEIIGKPVAPGTNFSKVQGLADVDGIVYIVDSNGTQAANVSTGLYRLPADFSTNTLAYKGTEVTATLVQPQSYYTSTGAGLWDLASRQESVSCPPAPTMEVDKRHGENAVSGPDGDGNFSVTYQIDAKNTGAAATTYSLVDKAMFGDGIEIVDARWDGHANGGPVSGAAISAAGGVTLAKDVPIDGNATHTYNVTVKFKAPAADYDRVRCEPGNGLFNRAVVKDGAAGSGHLDDDCLPPPDVPTAAFAVEKGPRPTADNQGAIQVGPDGTAELVYTVTVTNGSDSNGVTPEIWDRFWIPAEVTPAGAARVTVDDAAGVTGMPSSWTVEQMQAAIDPAQPALKLADSVDLAAGASRTFTIRIPVSVNVAAANWEELGRCEAGEGGSYKGGAPNTVFMDGDTSANNNDACIPLLPPQMASLTINKVGIDNVEEPLDGALFDLFPAGAEGNFDPNAQAIVKDEGAGEVQKWINLAPGKYYLVETKSPAEYELLPQPVGITISATDAAYSIRVDDKDVPVAQPVANDPYQLIVQVNDIKTGNLPLTGPRDQAFWYALALAVGMGMVLLNLGLFRRQR
ncbi:SpaA isopeptide-forming pilin-related protein [Corynebacterium sp. NPDC060344]|uniref:SpaA isopeptide-forming pilin-related protein n=1 Tax=Corynebacterium sp. NPDC060344 TaxID=3347101 RepID=UPI00365CC7D0